MTNPYYNHGTWPGTSSSGSSALARAELDAVTTGFSLLPTLAGQGGKMVVVNAGGTALINSLLLTESAGLLTIAGALTVTGGLTAAGFVAGTATALATPRTINGVAFDGTANITVADATKLPLTGGTLSGTLFIATGATRNGQAIDSTNAAGPFSSWTRSGTAMGFIGDGQIVTGGTGSDFGFQAPIGALLFATNGATEKMRLNANGNLLLGTVTEGFPSANRRIVDLNASSDSIITFKKSDVNQGYILCANTGDVNLNAITAALNLQTANVTRMSFANATADITAQGVAITRVKTASTARSSNTVVADDPHLVVPLGIGTWAVDMMVPMWATTTTTQGIKVSLAFSGTSTNPLFSVLGVANAAAAQSVNAAFGTALSFGNVTIAATAQGADFLRIQGTLTVTVAGNISFQWSQVNSSANATNVSIGAWMSCVKVG